ncbi:hypothetical protein M407DRAFT_26485 [Tulasnella calospora MUT 4182]|uniref:Peptidase C14 caspase domain-containing protein n=1 Tax=Tulasnella calospora MUT 4182 TaxID=1051891 RepID=A0A0C3QE83_9AGAM|nr:hypothetical protein M407DRAFT_26485 [Tulasnella calospora MUT 4182]
MGKPSAQVAEVFSRFSERVSDKLERGRRFFLEKTHFTTATSLVNSQSKSVATGPITHIIMICLSYHGMFWTSGPSMALDGPKHDFFLLLDHFKYGEPGNPIQFTPFHDFDVLRDNSDSQQKLIHKTDTSKAAITKAIKNTMQSVAPGDNVLFYFSGHAIEEPYQAIIAGDGELISGLELRDCLNNTPHDSVSVAAVFDACHTGGSMGLPYNYERKWYGTRVKRVTREKQEIPMIQISAARRGQFAYSNRFKDGYFGQLTWCLIQYLKTTTDSTIEGLTSYLYKNCDPTGAQLPQVSASHSFRGRVPFF